MGYDTLDLRTIILLYRYYDAVYYGDPPLNSSDTRFDSYMTCLKDELVVNNELKITPSVTYKRQVPWYVDSEEVGNYDVETDQYRGDVVAVAELSKSSGLMVGVHAQRDEAHAIDTGGIPAATYYYGKDHVGYNDYAVFGQYDLDTDWVNMSTGLRYEYEDAIGGHVVPRIAFTKAWDEFHLKLLYGQAARIPSINVLQAAVSELKAEQTKDYELEAGYRFSDSLSLVGNVFYMQVQKPILYEADAATGGDGYYNASNDLSSAGTEIELRWKTREVSSYLSYSYYRAVDNQIDYVRGGENLFLAAPADKITLSETWHMRSDLDWNVSGFWMSPRKAYLYANEGVGDLPSEFVMNTFLNYHLKSLSYGIGVANIFNVNQWAPQPYNGGSGPLPLKGREVFVRLAYYF